MIVNGKTIVIVNGKSTRVLGRRFNEALRASERCVTRPFKVCDASGRDLVPSKGLTWSRVAEAVREGKSIQARAL